MPGALNPNPRARRARNWFALRRLYLRSQHGKRRLISVFEITALAAAGLILVGAFASWLRTSPASADRRPRGEMFLLALTLAVCTVLEVIREHYRYGTVSYWVLSGVLAPFGIAALVFASHIMRQYAKARK